MFRTLGFPFEGKLSPKVTEEVSINFCRQANTNLTIWNLIQYQT